MTSSPTKQAQRCFDQIKEIWSGFDSDKRRVIPFCTPVIDRPECVVLGINHSVFIPGSDVESDFTADEFASALPARNAFLKSDFESQRLSDYAADIINAFNAIGVVITKEWMGANRCPVQSTDLNDIRNLPSFLERQKKSDVCLRGFLKSIAPKRIVLVGKFAAELYFPNAEKKGFDDLKQPKKGEFRDGNQTTIFAIEYPNSFGNRGRTNKTWAIDRLKKYWE